MKSPEEPRRRGDPALERALDNIVAGIHLYRRKRGSGVFLFCGCEPRVGTTTVAFNTAMATASAGWKTVLMDADIRGDGPDQGLGRYLKGDAAAEGLPRGTGRDNLYYISGGAAEGSSAGLLCNPRMGTLLGYLRERFDYAFIDAPAVGPAKGAEVLGALADEVVLVAAWERTEISRIAAAKKAMEEAGAHIPGIVVNRVDAASYDYMNKNKK